MSLIQKVKDLEFKNAEKEQTVVLLKRQKQALDVEQNTIRKVCDMQKDELLAKEAQVQDLEEKWSILKQESDAKYEAMVAEKEEEQRNTINEYQSRLTEQEDEFEKEKAYLKERLYEVTSNEENLFNRIKSLEADEGYNRAEVERAVAREREAAETQQQYAYKVECLERELANANQIIEEQAASVKTERDPEDVAQIEDQSLAISKLREEVAYFKQELIEARAHKSASDDDLGNVTGQLETLQNQIVSLSDEGTVQGR